MASDEKSPQTIDGATGKPDPLPPEKPRRRVDLSTLRDVRIELAHLYRKIDGGEIESSDGSRRAYVLRTIADIIEMSDLERRIEELEERRPPSGVRSLAAPTMN